MAPYRAYGPDMSAAGPRVHLYVDPDCPHAGLVERRVLLALRHLGTGGDIQQHVGAGVLSPTVCVGDRDVVTGGPPPSGVGCRLDLPTVAQISAAVEAPR